MSNAQLGLITTALIVILFAASLRAMGVLSTVATVSAMTLSAIFAAFLFLTQ